MENVQQEFTVLVADDSAIYRKLVGDALAGQYEVLVAKNGQEATRLILEHQPAVIITDWEMPDLTGPELCQQVRRWDLLTYIILLTSKDEKDNIVKGLAAGADDYLTKPFHEGELLARIA